MLKVESTVCSCYFQQLATMNDKIKISNPESAVFKKFMLLRNQLSWIKKIF